MLPYISHILKWVTKDTVWRRFSSEGASCVPVSCHLQDLSKVKAHVTVLAAS